MTFDPFAQMVDLKGEQFPSTPEWQWVADVEYEFMLNNRLNAFLGTNVLYHSEAVAAFGGLPEFELPEYTLVDLRAGVRSVDGRWRVQAWGRNVFDELYLINVSKVVDTVARTAGMPATYGVSFRYRF